jgi:peptidoglycan/LPS O-acetylase OafA/YrhL
LHEEAWRNLSAPGIHLPNPGETALARTLDDAPRSSDGSSAEPAAPTRRELRRARERLPRGAGPRSQRLGYQPALDGIRAFAVGAVLLYHAGQSWAVGGFLGVDTFFVLSGFLITSLLVGEWAGRGRIDLRAFWVRRAKRLLPALFVVMVGIVVYAAAFAAPGELDRIRGDSFSTLGYVANWRFVFSGQSYFDQFTQPSPLRHMWSLAIEEQFYLLWPLVVCFVLWWRRSLRALLVTCFALGAASAIEMAALYVPGRDPSRVYYGTDTRAQSLLIGAIVGILVFQHGPIRSVYGRVAVRIAAVIGAVYTLWLFGWMSERTDALYQGGFLIAALAVSAVIVSVVQPDRGVLGRALSIAPLRWVGRISYGLYLWHWPVYLTLTQTRTGLDGTALLVVRLAVSFALATVSFYLIEQPIRRGTLRIPTPRLAVLLIVVALVGTVIVSTSGGGESVAAQTTRALRAEAQRPQAAPPKQPTAVGPVAATKVLLVGDSVGGTMGLGFRTVGPEHNLWVWNRGRLGCGLFYGGSVYEGGELLPVDPECDWHQSWPEQLDYFKPDIALMLVGAWDILDREVDGHTVKFGTVEYDRSFLQQLDDATRVLGSSGAKVVVLTTPFFTHPEQVGQSSDFPEYDTWRVDRINSLYRDFLAQNPGRYTLIDLNAFVSENGRFTDTKDGVQIRGDGVHFTEAGSLMVDQWLAPQLEAIEKGAYSDTNEVERPDSRGLWRK